MHNSSIWTRRSILVLTATFCGMLWGSAHTCIKLGYEMFDISSDDTSSQILFAGTRFFIAGILVVLFMSAAGRKLLAPAAGDLKPIAVLSIFQTILQYVLFYFGLASASASRTSIISGTTSFVSIIIAVCLFRFEKLTFRKIAGCVLGFCGVVIMETAGHSIEIGFDIKGEGLVMLSVISSSFAANLIKLYGKNHNPVLLSAYQFMLGGAAMMAYGLATGGRMVYCSPSHFILIVYMAFISSAAYSLWGILLKYHPVSNVTIFSFITPAAGVVISAVILREYQSITGFTIAALILVCAGILVVSSEKQ